MLVHTFRLPIYFICITLVLLSSCEKKPDPQLHFVCEGYALFHTNPACRSDVFSIQEVKIRFSLVMSEQNMTLDDTACLGELQRKRLTKTLDNATQRDFEHRWKNSSGIEMLDDFSINKTTGTFGMGVGYAELGPNTPTGDLISIGGTCKQVKPVM